MPPHRIVSLWKNIQVSNATRGDFPLALLILLLIVIIFVLIAWSKVRIRMEYHRTGQDDRFFVLIAWVHGMLKFKAELTGLDLQRRLHRWALMAEGKAGAAVAGAEGDLDEQKKVPINRRNLHIFVQLVETVVRFISTYKRVLLEFISRVRVRRFIWSTRFGTGDAAATGISAGAVWAIKGLALQQVNRFTRMPLKQTEIKVIPDFAGSCLNMDLNCIFDIRIGHIIIAGCKILITRIKRGTNL